MASKLLHGNPAAAGIRLELPRAGKPVFRGPHGPVPYVARWSAEEVQDAPVVETRQGIAYADESSVDRDENGLLWSRVSSRPGVGEPLYRQMHPLRQRRAMRRLLCQICAGPADRNEHGTLWLIQDQRHEWPGWPERAQNTHPPLCLRCARIAVKACPWLKRGYVAVRARSFVSGASGGLFRTGWPRPRPVLADARTLQFGDPRLRWTQADQLVRELVGCTYVDEILAG
ncbi:hypothetical protein [Labedaea rhizosphaerae]|uniref:Uncharacterized protein n=1 Tax=Labedaea rhizosphaerae TaxID=598644 RepID=A0A4R6S358_LABRH|nr:hypothetical protein [Labedaea rhizosphaerae]TDP93644.1 hypothetical protein EV186_10638 [Labedaea rhizosphaerae]